MHLMYVQSAQVRITDPHGGKEPLARFLHLPVKVQKSIKPAGFLHLPAYSMLFCYMFFHSAQRVAQPLPSLQRSELQVQMSCGQLSLAGGFVCKQAPK